MLVLNNTTSTLEIVLAATVAASQCDVVVSYDLSGSELYTPSKQVSQTNNVTAATILSAPASTYQSIVHFLNVYNADTASVTVTVRLKDTALAPTTYILHKVTLLTLEHLTYTHAGGWRSMDANGSLK